MPHAKSIDWDGVVRFITGVLVVSVGICEFLQFLDIPVSEVFIGMKGILIIGIGLFLMFPHKKKG